MGYILKIRVLIVNSIPVAAQLAQPHHQGEHVRVVLEQRAAPHVLHDPVLAVSEPHVVDLQ